ncbi:pancreatic triacylglycerol lipase-like [Diadema setosum]|uniref:pancreatic triacylglycerol lipase-like n=1 Tax=Diadema setosum TaxID=31175 RepID=UPI003B3BCC89
MANKYKGILWGKLFQPSIRSILYTLQSQDGAADTVTYDDLGSFSYGNGAPICHHAMPESPEDIRTRFWLFTRSNTNSGQELDRKSSKSIRTSYFSASRDTKFIIHGYTDEYTSGWAMDMKNALLTKNTNVIMVDWQEGAGRLNYATSRANTRVVGREIANLIELLASTTGASYGSMHIIGHSLGAHTAGYAGEARSGIGRLTGLDPAGPEFSGYENECKLDSSDANFVDAIHTDGGATGAGLLEQLGHQDFYPNEGVDQPGCEGTSVLEACDHMRATHLFTESVTSSCSFSPSHKCSSWSSYPNCARCGSCPEMGYNAQKSRGTGAFFIETNGASPFCA